MGSKGGAEYEVGEYYLAVDFGVCHGPLDSVNEIWIKEQKVWVGSVVANGTIAINERDIFGGRKKEGGVYGMVDVYLGTDDQRMSSGTAARYGLEPDDAPGYRGIAHLMFRGPESSEVSTLFNTPSNPDLNAPPPDFAGRIQELTAVAGAAFQSLEFNYTPSPTRGFPEQQQGFMWGMNNPYMPSTWITATRVPRGWLDDIAAVPRSNDIQISTVVELDALVHSGVVENGIPFSGFIVGTQVRFEMEEPRAWSAWGGIDRWLTNFHIIWSNGDVVEYTLSPGGGTQFPFSNVWDTEAEAIANAVPIDIEMRSPGGTILLDHTYTTTDNSGGLSIRMTGFAAAQADANPAHIVRECLTNPKWGLGADPSEMSPSFDAAAQLFYDENFGLSMQWTQQSDIEKVVQEVLDHVQAMVYIDPDTGLWDIVPIRGDYNVEDLLVLDPSNCRATNRQRKAISETVNEIVVTYMDPGSHEEASLTVQDIAHIGAVGGIRSESRNYYGVRSAALAQELGARDLRAASHPLFSCDLEVDTTVGRIKPGQVVVLNWPDDNLYDMVLRVYRVDYGKPGSSVMKLTVTEDVFSLGTASYDAPPESLDDSFQAGPIPVEYLSIVTPPLPLLLRSGVALSDVEDEDYPGAIMAVLGQSPGEPLDTLRLTAEVTKPNSEVVEEVIAEVPDTPMNLSTILFSPEAETVVSGDSIREMLGVYTNPETGDFLQLGMTDVESEIVMLYSYDSVADEYVVARGIFDTVPREWAIGTPVWYLGTSLNQLDPSENASGSPDFYRVQTANSRGVLPFSQATTHNFTPSDRHYAPHRPANVTFDGQAFPTDVIDAESAGQVVITWANRDRLGEDVVAPRWNDANVTPEVNQETNIVLLDPNTGAEVNRITGLTGTSYTLLAGSFMGRNRLTVKVVAVRDGFESLQGHQADVQIAGGYGYAYGFNYGGA